MKRNILTTFFIALCVASTAYGANSKGYQVTGPILEVTSDKIVVQKGKDKWELERDAATKITGDLAVGQKVTIQYRMAATDVEVKGGATKK